MPVATITKRALQRRNWYFNPGAEVGDLTQWQAIAACPFAVTTEDKYAGSRSMKYTPNSTTTTQGPLLYVAPPAAERPWSGGTFRVSFWVKGTAGRSVIVAGRCNTVSTTWSDLSQQTVTLTGDWQRLLVTATLPWASDGRSMEFIQFGAQMVTASSLSTQPGVVYYVDSVCIELHPDGQPFDYADDYFDGSMAGCRWTGTAYYSYSEKIAPVLVSVANARIWRTDSTRNTIRNGFGELGNNTNFNVLVYDAADKPVEDPTIQGSFYSTVNAHAPVTGDPILVDINASYVLSLWARQRTAGDTARAYSGFVPYDRAHQIVSPTTYMYQANTTTTLAQNLVNGATKVYLTSAANWHNSAGASTHLRSLIFWDWVDSFGTVWPTHTYSRATFQNVYDDGAVNYAENSITLRVPWAGSTYLAGRPVSNGSSGSSYIYVGMPVNVLLPSAWTQYTGVPVTGRHSGPNSNADTTRAWPHGTHWTRVIFLLNRSNATSRHAVAGVKVTTTGLWWVPAKINRGWSVQPTQLTYSTSDPLTSPTVVLPTAANITKRSMIPLAVTTVTPNFFVNDAHSQGNTVPPAWAVEFDYTGTDVVFKLRASPTADSFLEFFVDGVSVTTGPQAPTGITLAAGTIYYARLVLPAGGTRRITARGRYAGLYDIRHPASATITASTVTKPKVAAVGASYTLNLDGQYHQLQAWPWLFGDDARVGADVLQAGIGGTGYTVGTVYNTTARVDRLATWTPGYVVVEGSGNDDSATYATTNAAAATYFSTLNTRLPSVPVIVVGAMPKGDVSTLGSGRAQNLKAVRDAALAAPNVIRFIDPVGTAEDGTVPATYTSGAAYAQHTKVIYQGAVYRAKVAVASAPATLNAADWDLMSWFTGTGNAGAPAGDGTRDTLLGADDAHPTSAGQVAIADRIAAVYAGVVADPGLLLRYTFTGTGTLVPDVTGSERNGTATDAAMRVGGAVTISATTHRVVRISDVATRPPLCSVSAWVNVAAGGGGGEGYPIHHARAYDSTTFGMWMHRSGSDVEVQAVVRSANNVHVFTAPTFTQDAWHHLALTYDGVNSYLYVDGVVKVSAATTGSLVWGTETDRWSWQVGNHQHMPAGMVGYQVDDVRIYNRGLSAAEVTSLAGTRG